MDDLVDIANLEGHVRDSDLLLIFLTKGYLASSNCRRELKQALQANKEIVVISEEDANHGAATFAEFEAELDGLSDEDRAACQTLLDRVDSSDAFEWHRENYLKRVVLREVITSLCRAQDAHQEIMVTDRLVAAHGAIKLEAPCYISPHYAQVRVPRQVRLGNEKNDRHEVMDSMASQPDWLREAEGFMSKADAATGAPTSSDSQETSLYAELHQRLGTDLGIECSSDPDRAQIGVHTTTKLPAVMLLTPAIFSNTALVTEIKQLLGEQDTHRKRKLVAFYSTAVPFDFYTRVCPEELKALGLLKITFTKWPAAPALQRAALTHVLSPISLRPSRRPLSRLPRARVSDKRDSVASPGAPLISRESFLQRLRRLLSSRPPSPHDQGDEEDAPREILGPDGMPSLEAEASQKRAGLKSAAGYSKPPQLPASEHSNAASSIVLTRAPIDAALT